VLKQLRTAGILFGIFTIINGLLYPALITGIAQVVFPYQANGSLIIQNSQVVGSALIGQQFDDPKYFWGRLSATVDHPYNASASGGSNLGPTNPALWIQITIYPFRLIL
jgi:K+-transporting ATPase ATPase C chain